MSQTHSSCQRPISSYRADSPDVFWLVLFFVAALNWMESPRSQASVSLGVCGSTVSPAIFLPAIVFLVLISLGSKDR